MHPKGIEVRGSRYAVVLGELKEGDLDLDLTQYKIGYGPSRGKMASEYVQGRVDKACMERIKEFNDTISNPKDMKRISHYGKIVDPYAVFVR